MIASLLSLFIVLCIVGLILWGIGQIPGIPGVVKTVIYGWSAWSCCSGSPSTWAALMCS